VRAVTSPQRAARAWAILVATVVASCSSPVPAAPVPIAGCDLFAGRYRCEEVVEAASARLPARHADVTAVRVGRPSDRQLAFSGRGQVVANVEFEFADGSSVRIPVRCDGVPTTRRCLGG